MKFRYLFVFCQFLIGSSVLAQQSGQSIRLKSGIIPRSKNIQNQRNLTATLQQVRYQSRYYTLIQFSKLPGHRQKTELAQQGVVLHNYIPQNSFLAEVSDRFAPGILKKYAISGVFTLEPGAKIADGLLQQLSETTAVPDKLIAVHFFGSMDKAVVATELKQVGAQVITTRIQPSNVIFIQSSASVVQKIALLPFVVYISSQHIKDVPINYNNIAAHAINALSASAGRNLKGQHVALGIGDNADISTHLDFSGRLVNHFPFPPADHGTHTAGTMAGAGIVNPKHKGIAPKATIINQFFSDILVNTPYYVVDHNMVLTNNSYYSGMTGCPGEGDYDVLSNYVDAQMNYDQALLHVFAAGNDGNYTCSPYPASYATIKSGFQCGKNVLTVGAVNNANHTIATFSSRGPVDDGRLKPEIVAGGFGIVSATPYNNYGAGSGTSMAAPTATGTLALLYERYRQLNGGVNPPAALIKAISCNTADDLGNPGPDFTYGFGNLNGRTAVEAIEGNHYFISGVTPGRTTTHRITGVPAGTEQIKIMLYWNDPAAAPYAATTLVNNLDLTVTVNSSIHHPLVPNPNSVRVNRIAVEGVDNTNNIEQVVINHPPSGEFIISVSGTDVPTGSQEYVVVYQIVQPSVTVEYPSGEETFVPGEQETIRWSAHGSNSNTFRIEYSVNNGSTWTTISNTIAATSRLFVWGVPNLPTGNALIRVTRNGAGYSDVSDHPFTILGQPSLTVSNTCPGYAQLSWGAIPSATSYEIMMLKGNDMQTIATSSSTSYLLGGLHKDSTYWLSVRALNPTSAGRRSISRSITPSGGTCPSPTFDNDFTVDLLVAPVTGRGHTSSQLGISAPQVRVKNLGSLASSSSFAVSYQINNGSIVTENGTQSIAAGSTYTHTFINPCDLSVSGTYRFKVWVSYASDVLRANDTLFTIVKHLQNDPIVLSPSYTEGFEGSMAKAYSSSVMGFDDLDRCDFQTSSANGRARTFVNTALVRSGNRAVTLDQQMYSTTSSADSLITTFNLSNYSSGDQLWLDYYYQNQGIDFNLPGNQVWIRGSEKDTWIPVLTLPVDNPSHFGKYIAAAPVNITETLASAVPAQTVSSSFQVKFGQQGFTSTNSVIPNGNLDDGFTFDDVTITLASNDVSVKQVISPAVNNICGLGSSELVSVRVKNYSSVVLNNVPVSYNLNGFTVTEKISSLLPDQELVYTFAQKADLSSYQSYALLAWVHYRGDNYINNDTVTINFTSTPVITNYPYLQGFETDNGHWYTGGMNSSWQWGKPDNAVISKAANGSNIWVTNLTGNHNNGELSYLYSPCFDLSGLSQPVLSFSHMFRTEDDCNCDFHWVEYSTDGITWLKLGTAGEGTNWYDDASVQAWKISNNRWHVSSHDIPSVESSMRFRFVMHADAGVSYEGIGIDDVHVFDKASIYSGANIANGFTRHINDSSWIHFDLNGDRIASVNSHGQNLGNTTLKIFTNTGQVRHNGYQFYLDRNIVLQPAIAPQKPVSIRYYFKDTEASNLVNATGCLTCHKVRDPYEVGITQYSGTQDEENGTLADNDRGTYHFITPQEVSVIPYDNGYFAEYQVTQFSEFWINSGGPRQNLAIPHVVDSFRVTKDDETALLQWITWIERDTDKFVIEKSGDHLPFIEIGTVTAAKTTNSISEYQFTDGKLLWGTNRYRIKTVNKDGSAIYSSVQAINYHKEDLSIIDSFTATKYADSALLEWTMVKEVNAKEFLIEKASDGIIFSPIGETPAANDSALTSVYQFVDTDLSPGLNYYRIKTLNVTGQFVYSVVRAVHHQQLAIKQVDSFRVTKQGNRVLLEWMTIHEPRIDKYIIERSDDNIRYTMIGKVPALSVNTFEQYHFFDEQPLWGINYYRIKTVANTGHFAYSDVRMIDMAGTKLIVHVYPNPIKKRIIYVRTTVDCTRLQLHDLHGRMITWSTARGKLNELLLPSIRKGIYFLTIFTDAGKLVVKVVVE